MKKVLFGMMGISTLVLSNVSLAAGQDLSSVPFNQQTGVYASVGAGYGNVDARGFSNYPGLINYKNDNDGFAWIISLGYQFSPYFAAEAGYFRMPTLKTTASEQTSVTFPGLKDPVVINGTYESQIKLNAIYIAGKGIFPVSGNLDIFAKVGIARMEQKVTAISTASSSIATTTIKSPPVETNELVFLGGIGADYYVTNNLAITVQGLATLTGSDTPATFLATAGLSYKFSV